MYVCVCALEISLKLHCIANLARHLAQHSIGDAPWSGSCEAWLKSPASRQQATACPERPRCSRQPLPWPVEAMMSGDEACSPHSHGLAAVVTDKQLWPQLANPPCAGLYGSLPSPIFTGLHWLHGAWVACVCQALRRALRPMRWVLPAFHKGDSVRSIREHSAGQQHAQLWEWVSPPTPAHGPSSPECWWQSAWQGGRR